MPTTVLPQEIVDKVIDCFHDDFSNLKECALVCQEWLSSSRFHIFHTITLRPPTFTTRNYIFKVVTDCQRLYKIIESSPEIAYYVRNLTICEGMLKSEWITKDRTLPLLLRKLHSLQGFRIERSASMKIFWKSLPGELREAMGIVLTSPALLELQLVGLVFDCPAKLLRILQGCKILRVLHATHLRFQDETSLDLSPTSPTQHQHAPLDDLYVGPRTSTALITCLLHPESTIEVTTVRKLGVCISENFSDVARLLRSTSSVEVLEIVLMNDIDLQAYWSLAKTDRIDMSHNPHLHTLEIKIDVIQRQDDPLPWLHDLFSTFETPNALQRINIVYTLFLPSPYMDRSVNTTIFTGWNAIDATLSGPEFVHLKKVKLDFALENPIGYGIAPRFLKEVELPSPALRASGVLEMDAHDTSDQDKSL